MSAPAADAPTQVRQVSSSSRYTSQHHQSEQPQRSHSSGHRTTTGQAAPHRSSSQVQSRPPSSSRHAPQLVNVARRDQEQTNLARTPSSRPESRNRLQDRHGDDGRTATHTRTTSRTYARPSTDGVSSGSRLDRELSARSPSVGGAPLPNPGVPGTLTSGAALGPSGAALGSGGVSGSGSARRRTTIVMNTGEWTLGKTIGAGSMGKVKLAKNLATGEQGAIKIVPRHSTDEHRTQQDRDRADNSKEIRTAREAAIVSLVNHPYICGMRDVHRTNHHWYMVFEYVNGGQMLDYIISHGRLKEKQARKFGRQIASALDYCHRNSIVHRDLKIENILISKEGNIKIIDFGLSNLFAPRNTLKTFCGSLYFAAPELLQARAYTGPEVDIWSCGIVLYVLVCGKVPFDDQSMPQLHAKIKKGLVEYPPWLSSECKHIISRMLVTDPKSRASLAEIMAHPWMTKGFHGPPENFLPLREPIQLPLDETVLQKMQGFDFGSTDFIKRQMSSLLESEDYQKSLKLAAKRPTPNEGDRKKHLLDFYQRRKLSNSKDTLSPPSNEALQLGEDPVNAFSPLLSIYYLAREKQEREREEANPGALNMPQSPGEKPLQMPSLPAPEPALTNTTTYEMTGEQPTGGRSRPRARTHGEDELTQTVAAPLSQAPSPLAPQETPPKKESSGIGILRRFSTRRGRDTTRQSEREKAEAQPPLPPTTPIVQEPAAPLRPSFSVRKTRERDAPPSAFKNVTDHHPDLLAPPTPESPRRLIGLGRSTSVNSADVKRRWTTRRSHDAASNKSDAASAGSDTERVVEKQPSPAPSPEPTRRLPNRAQSTGHSRRGSIIRTAGRPVVAGDVPEETDQELAEEAEPGPGAFTKPNASQEMIKPVYLKGLFSVSTTSNKPLTFIRADIIRVLSQLGVEYREIRGGFSCRHAPSIDINKVLDMPNDEQRDRQSFQHRRKISFAGKRADGRDDAADVPGSSSAAAAPMSFNRPFRSTSRRRAPESNETTEEEVSDEDGHGKADRLAIPHQNQHPQQQQQSHQHGQRIAGETTTHVQSDLGKSMVLRFEIVVVKVPFLSLHGLQFKKLDGGTWQYKKMAENILALLKL